MQRSIEGITLNWCAAAAGGEDDILDVSFIVAFVFLFKK